MAAACSSSSRRFPLIAAMRLSISIRLSGKSGIVRLLPAVSRKVDFTGSAATLKWIEDRASGAIWRPKPLFARSNVARLDRRYSCDPQKLPSDGQVEDLLPQHDQGIGTVGHQPPLRIVVDLEMTGLAIGRHAKQFATLQPPHCRLEGFDGGITFRLEKDLEIVGPGF